MAIGRIPEPGTGIPESIIAAKGDLIVGTANDTPGILSVGTDGHTLVADSVETTGLKWAAPAAGGLTLSQIATGSLTSGTSVTISSLSAYDFLQIQLVDIDPSASSGLFVRINGDNSGLYAYSYFSILGSATAANVVVGGGSRTATNFRFDAYENINPTTISNNFQMTLTNCKSAGFTSMSGVAYYIDSSGAANDRGESYEGIYRSAAAVSSLVISLEGVNTFQAGTYYIYGG